MTVIDIPRPLQPLASEHRALLRTDPCAYCPRRQAGTIDHITPRSRRGGINPANLTGACDDCNQDKGPETLLLWLLARH